jgi:hypothetical protein
MVKPLNTTAGSQHEHTGILNETPSKHVIVFVQGTEKLAMVKSQNANVCLKQHQ